MYYMFTFLYMSIHVQLSKVEIFVCSIWHNVKLLWAWNQVKLIPFQLYHFCDVFIFVVSSRVKKHCYIILVFIFHDLCFTVATGCFAFFKCSKAVCYYHLSCLFVLNVSERFVMMMMMMTVMFSVIVSLCFPDSWGGYEMGQWPPISARLYSQLRGNGQPGICPVHQSFEQRRLQEGLWKKMRLS